jgi:hypothetical protein
MFIFQKIHRPLHKQQYTSHKHGVLSGISRCVGYLMMLSVSELHNFNDSVINGCGAVGGMRTGRGNRKPSPMPLCPPQIPHDLRSNPGLCDGKPATNRLNYGKNPL